MHGKQFKLEEQELDRLVLDEFDRIAKAAHPKITPISGKGDLDEEPGDSGLEETGRNTADGSPVTEEHSFVDQIVAWLCSREDSEAILESIRVRLAACESTPPYPSLTEDAGVDLPQSAAADGEAGAIPDSAV